MCDFSVGSAFTEKSTEVRILPGLHQDPDQSEQKASSQGVVGHALDPAVTIATSSAEVDLKDPNKYCALCTASFTTPHVALQHYNGRKHQRNQARQELLKQLGHDVEQGTFWPLSKHANAKGIKGQHGRETRTETLTRKGERNRKFQREK